MYSIIDDIKTGSFNGLQTSKIYNENDREIILIKLEKDCVFKKHTSPKDAALLVLKGRIRFHINENEYILKKHQLFNFPKEVEHWVEANQNSTFLIIR